MLIDPTRESTSMDNTIYLVAIYLKIQRGFSSDNKYDNRYE